MTIEKIKQIAREKYGKELTDEQAAKIVEKTGKLSDEELDNAAGGACSNNVCPQCGANVYYNFRGSLISHPCLECGYEWKD